MKRLEVLGLLNELLEGASMGGASRCFVSIPRYIHLFGIKFKLGSKRSYFLTDLNKEEAGMGVAITIHSLFKTKYSARLNSMGIVEDMLIHTGSKHLRVSPEDLDYFYDTTMNDLTLLRDHIRSGSAEVKVLIDRP